MSMKAFEFVPVLELGPVQTRIECIECCGQSLYIGTYDGFLLVYKLQEKPQENEREAYSCRKEGHKFLDMKKPIKCIKTASALNRILVLCDSSLLLLDMVSMDTIGGGPQLQGVTTFCVNENPNIDDPFCTQICVAYKRKLKIYNVTDKKFHLVKDISVPEAAQDVSVDGACICAALLTQYKVFNFEDNDAQELFPFDSDDFIPIIRRITKDEFLVTAPGGLGMFVTSEGVSKRPPIQWSCQLSADYFNSPGIIALAYSHPYILGLNNDFIVIHSILDQQQKQTLPFLGGLTLGNFDGRLYVSSASSVYYLRPVPWEMQVEALLADYRIDEALELAQNANKVGITKEQFSRMFQIIQRKAAFLYFSNADFRRAREMFLKSLVDVREVIAIFPKLLPQSTNFVRSIPPLHNIADIEQLFHRDEVKLKLAYLFLRQLLEELRHTGHLTHQYEIDTALVKLYAASNRGDLEAFILAGEVSCDVKGCLRWLERLQCYHSQALLHRLSRNNKMAFQVWSKLVSGEIEDESFPGLEFFVECLSSSKDADLVWQYADFILERNETIGVQIFTKGPEKDDPSDKMNPEHIVSYLGKYPLALIEYLKFLVMEKNTVKEEFHTHLALLYLELILKMRKESAPEDEITNMRKNYQKFLQESSLYRVQLLLGKIKSCGLDQETAILHGKVGEHDKALDLLVHRLKDYEAAETYCEVNTRGKDRKHKQKLFHILLGCYLNPTLESSRSQELIEPALAMLNRQSSVFDATKVLEILPPEWSITVVGSFLKGALRTSLHQYRTTKVESALMRGENLQRRFSLYDLQRNSILIEDSNYCCVCKKPFLDGSFARYPNNVVTHVACARQNDICPVTGKTFRSLSPTFTNR